MITVIIDGRQIRLDEPVTILEAARSAGITIPTLCHHDYLEAYGGCRLCLVEIDKVPRLQTSCTALVKDGMIVRTHSEAVLEARKSILEFLLINHPLDCPVCDKAGICDLQDSAVVYGASLGRFAEQKRELPESLADPLIVRSTKRCIACTRCVRMCDLIQGASAISMVKRSGRTVVEPFSGAVFDCEYCGNCIMACPVGALASRKERFIFRPWMVEKEVSTVCAFCGVGCSLTVHVRSNAIVGVIPGKQKGTSPGLLCNKGTFGYDFVGNPERLRTPLVRQGAELTPTSWEEALGYAASRLKKIKEGHGGRAIAGIASGRCTNEDYYVFGKFLRTVLESNNIDTPSGLSYGFARALFERFIGPDSVATAMDAFLEADGLIVLGGDPTSISPILGLKVRNAVQRGVSVVTVGTMPGFRYFDTIKLAVAPQAETPLLQTLVSLLYEKKKAGDFEPWLLSAMEAIKDAPSMTAQEAEGIGHEQLAQAVRALSGSRPSIVVGPDIVRRDEGHRNLLLVACLAALSGGRIHLLSELPNEFGAFDLGIGPMGRGDSGERGMGIGEIIDAAAAHEIKALCIMGDNPLLTLPDAAKVRKALESLELLIVQDTFFTETARFAHVVFPALSWAERNGTYTNLEGRVQRLQRALKSGEREHWRIVADMSRHLGFEMGYKDEREIFADLAATVPSYKHLSFDNPETALALRHSAPMHEESGKEEQIKACLVPGRFASGRRGNGLLLAAMEYPLRGWGDLERRSQSLRSIALNPYARIGPELSLKLGLGKGDRIVLSTRVGEMELDAVIDQGVPADTVMLPVLIMPELMEWKMNPVTKSPVLDTTELEIRKAR